MANESTPHTQPQQDPAQTDMDIDQISSKVGTGYDGREFQELKDAQTAGSRNERATEYNGNEHKTEPTTASEYPAGQMHPKPDAVGVTNHSVRAEEEQQARVPGKRPDAPEV